MAKPNKKDAAKEFLAGIFAKIPEDKRQSIQEVLEVDDVLDIVGDGVLRQSEFSRRMDELSNKLKEADGKYSANVEWYEANKDALETALAAQEKLAALEAGGGNGNGGGTSPDLSGYVKQDDIAKLIAARETQALGLMSVMNNITAKHSHEFKEPLDTLPVIKLAQEQGLDYVTAYDRMVAPRREERVKKEQEDALKAAKEEGRQAAIREFNSVPYPVGNEEPSTLAGLSAKPEQKFGLAAAIDDLHRMRAGQTV